MYRRRRERIGGKTQTCEPEVLACRLLSAATRCQNTGRAARSHWRSTHANLRQELFLGCLGDLVRRLSNGPYGASYGLLRGLIGDTKWTYKVS